MARHRYEDDNDPVGGIISSVFVFYVIYLVILWFSNKARFWHWIWYGVIVLAVILLGIYAWSVFRDRRREKKAKLRDSHFDTLINNLEQATNPEQPGLKEYVENFIDRFGRQKAKKSNWTYRGYSFDWERLEDFRKVLNEKGMHLSLNELNDTTYLLRHYIQQREENLTRETISLRPNKFADLSGSDFENLLYRLFSAMGYTVQQTGKVGDQGGDLVATMKGDRIVIQAKRYNETVSNAAVQQVVAAQKQYGCNKAMVVTNSGFTQEASELAKVNNVELIEGNKLNELLLQYLKESWS